MSDGGAPAWLGPLLAAGGILYFVVLWAAVTTLLSVMSGWLKLAKHYPDRPDEPAMTTIRWVSGQMGVGVNLRSVLTLETCASGLRLKMLRALGPFCRPFLVPWGEIRTEKKKVLFWEMTKLQFGAPKIGSLTIRDAVASDLAQASMGHLKC